MFTIKKKWEKNEICIPKTHFKKNVYKNAKKLRELISEEQINDLAKSCRWQERERKFTGMDLLKTMVFMGQSNYQLSLRERCSYLLSCGVKISKQALDKRLNKKAVVFIKSILEAVLKLKLMQDLKLAFLKDFSSVKIIDATSFQLPETLAGHYPGFGVGASKSGIKPHYQLSITNGDTMALEVVHGRSADPCTSLIAGDPGDLLLFDLGYFDLNTLQDITQQKACYVSRIKYNTQVWMTRSGGLERLNWQEQINKMQVGQIEELQVYLGVDKKVKTRLIIEKVPDQIAHQKRRKLKTDKVNKRKVLSKARLAFCTLNVFISNTTKEQLSKDHIRAVYSLRWQIEIYFKTWKSYINIDKLEKMNIHRFNCTHYASLVYIILSTKIFLFFKQRIWKEHGKELSELKAMKLLAKQRNWLWEVLYHPLQKARDRLENLEDILNTHCIKENKKGKLTPWQTMKVALS